MIMMTGVKGNSFMMIYVKGKGFMMTGVKGKQFHDHDDRCKGKAVS